ncbi:hypothetical protein BLA29_007261 [Euroglyphus maynei]|uniref:Uncharacterized protein n=1 Tax=Euroglyphus maynei TaxID=6958 RepID=A0A1Y3B5G7_EURMA|nr:hypothetical protein BLA29_007261 [Euroglyphus maynei]
MIPKKHNDKSQIDASALLATALTTATNKCSDVRDDQSDSIIKNTARQIESTNGGNGRSTITPAAMVVLIVE